MTAGPDVKAAQLAGRWWGTGFDTIHYRARRAGLQVCGQRIHRILSPLHHDADRSANIVGDPTGQAEVLGAAHDVPAKADSLNAAMDGGLEALLRHYATLVTAGRV